jgi:hypothetical protein
VAEGVPFKSEKNKVRRRKIINVGLQLNNCVVEGHGSSNNNTVPKMIIQDKALWLGPCNRGEMNSEKQVISTLSMHE